MTKTTARAPKIRHNLIWRLAPWEHTERAGQRCRVLRTDGERSIFEFVDGSCVEGDARSAIKPKRIVWKSPAARKMRVRLYRAAGYACAQCEFRTSPPEGYDGSRAIAGLVIDHKVPFVLGGSNEEHNLQVLCEPCNQRKWCKVTSR